VDPAAQVTLLLADLKNGDPQAVDRLIPIVYDELRRLASHYLRDEHAAATLQPTALVHEAYLKLVGQEMPDWESRSHFCGVAAHALESFYQTTVAVATPPRVGPYRLVRELGRGGMGTVFLAERDDDQYRAKVAVKLVRPGMDTEFILARFRRERQTLARLQHPNISRLLDGGTTEHGLPYIVMEYIDGPWITTYADRHQFGLQARLRMFQDVCSAVDYAHRNLIVHRDLKPGNMLVDAAGVPKLLDFGICKLLMSESPADTMAPPMTPSYASPEQIRGEAATILSDVYSLGAVLYELLTGRGPRRFDNLTPVGIQRALEVSIVTPSAAVGDKRLARQLAGDVDSVVMHALDADPQHRYESAAQLAEDLRRYLRHEPVRARAPSLGYRASKFVRRHRVGVTAAAIMFVALAVGLAISTYEARIASVRLEQVRTLANRLVFDLHDAIHDLPGSTKARQIIVQTGLEYLKSAVESAKGNPAAQVELAKAYRRLGDVQGDINSSNLGDAASALSHYRSAQALLDEAIRGAPNDIDARTEQLILYRRLGTFQRDTGRLKAARQILQEGIRAGAPFAASRDPAFRAALAGLYIQSADATRNMGDADRALPDASEALRLYSDAVSLRPADPDLAHEHAGAYAEVGMAEVRLGRLEDALAHFRLGTAEMEKLVSADPTNTSCKRDLMLAYGHIGDVLGNPNQQNLGIAPARSACSGKRPRLDGRFTRPIRPTSARLRISALRSVVSRRRWTTVIQRPSWPFSANRCTYSSGPHKSIRAT
jgi:tetratricopeptide (TPR) repeat protein/tRNA A-37 threonylcarbamoyl transferase component Bud32